MPNINTAVLRKIASHHRSCGVKSKLKGLPYERCAELSWVVEQLQPRFQEDLRYLDVGTGESPLPTFLYANTNWDITCLDKFAWVRKQHAFLKMVNRCGVITKNRFRVIESELLQSSLPAETFDIITLISVIEHFEGNSDSAAMKACARLLRPGGQLILTTPMNEPYFAEFYLNTTVYGAQFHGAPVFYQRHYDEKRAKERLLEPSGLVERQRVYFGDYEFQCFERVLQLPKLLRALYVWNTTWLAARYLTYRSYPVGRKAMRMNTSSGMILVLEKPPLN